MLFNFGYQSVALLIFFFHELVFALLLLRKGLSIPSPSDLWLSLFIFLCTLYITPWMLGHAGWYAHDGYREVLFFVPFQQLFLIGPVIFFYTNTLLNPSFRFSKKAFLHLIPAIGYGLYTLVIFIADQFIFENYYFYADGRDRDLDTWYQVSGLLSMISYTAISLRTYYHYKERIFDTVSFAESIRLRWLQQFLSIFLLILLTRIVFLLLFPHFGDFGSKWWYYLIFAGLTYYIALAGYTNTIREAGLVKLPVSVPNPYSPNEAKNSKQETPSQQEHNTNDQDLQEWVNRIKAHFFQYQPYKDPTLTLLQLAKETHTSPNQLSRVINKGFEMNLNDFINQYRVEAVKKALGEPQHQHLTLLAIALDCGFNSKTTFNRAFKKHTNSTPAQYLAAISKKDQGSDHDLAR